METQTLKMTDYNAPGLKDHINNDPLSRAQDQYCTIFIGDDDVGNPDVDGTSSTSEDDPTPEVDNKNKEPRRWRKKAQPGCFNQMELKV